MSRIELTHIYRAKEITPKPIPAKRLDAKAPAKEITDFSKMPAPLPKPGGRWVWVSDDEMITKRSKAKSRVYNREYQCKRRAAIAAKAKSG